MSNKELQTISYNHLINHAKLLLSEDGENEEYDRALIELINSLTHVPITDILLDVQAHNTLYITFCLDK
jgi:hypothetical protein